MAGYPTVQTTEPGMQRAAQEFSNKATDFTGELQRVNGEMATLQSTWHGDASARFNAAMDEWERNFQIVINKLISMMDVMGVNTKEYSAAEDEASSTAGSFAATLPGV